MDKEKYMELHHHITESQIGLARMHLSAGDPDKAKQALDKCSEQLKEITKARFEALGIDITQFGEHWK